MIIVGNKELFPRVYKMVIISPSAAETAVPGQFLHIRCSEGFSPLLRRPISISGVHTDEGTVEIIYRVVGEGTKWLSKRAPGYDLDILGPLGHGFPLPATGANPVLVGGGLGVAPLLFLAQRIAELRDANLSLPRACIGFSTAEEVYGVEELKAAKFDIHVTTDDGTYGKKGFPTDLLQEDIKSGDILYACGPLPLLSKVASIGRQRNIAAYISLEERMACGIGACIGCSVKSEGEGYLKVCKDGPVFEAGQVILGGEGMS